MLKGLGFHPTGPAEPAGTSELHRRNISGFEHELDVPEIMFAAVIQHPASEPLKGVAVGKHALVVNQFHRTEMNAKIQLAFVIPGAEDGIDSQAPGFRRSSELTDAVWRQVHPAADERFDSGFNFKILA